MSAAWELALPPATLISPASFSPAAPSRSRIPTAHPCSARRRQIAAPMPLAPPVTRTVLPFNPRIVSPALAGQHARRLVADHDLAVLVLDVVLGCDDTAIALRGRPNRGHLDLGVNGVAD